MVHERQDDVGLVVFDDQAQHGHDVDVIEAPHPQHFFHERLHVLLVTAVACRSS